jgi:hypothetical protein
MNEESEEAASTGIRDTQTTQQTQEDRQRPQSLIVDDPLAALVAAV